MMKYYPPIKKNKRAIDLYCNVDESQSNHAEWKKPDKKRI